jgi:hypothetical protein
MVGFSRNGKTLVYTIPNPAPGDLTSIVNAFKAEGPDGATVRGSGDTVTVTMRDVDDAIDYGEALRHLANKQLGIGFRR